ncbi:MAG: hypothetical protein SFU56_17560 [Capsulimonadales bacterium]|nr:hypothetical protein [Capsulimonadales bacterium]
MGRTPYDRFLRTLVCAVVWTLPLVGCQPDDGVPASEKAQAQRLDTIARDSGGDWEKLSETDKAYLIKEIAHGKESDARMILLAKAGKLRRPAGGPQPGGPQPGGPGMPGGPQPGGPGMPGGPQPGGPGVGGAGRP